ncbi:MucBP domain-containing protein [Carnobacterium maltaromaticum]|uniref:MucBP domain-containing protein n=1 Tax=Carnobacterium maltaromaticum TaxID=2751 RepID=UPI001071FE06|nr:MucBP domain-containing protein [Carnobacterium maltaromaticum]TFJ70068.1 mucBP domain-containing protein [Carnobacterium maltaromaticum]TFJ75987.1 mucBP domain-containing protein [Carnobacterium maltaromaticum]
MNTKKSSISTNFLLIGILFYLTLLVPPASAAPIAAEGLIDVGEDLQLSYYFGKKPGNVEIEPNRVQVANVNFLTKGKRIQHLFGNGSNKGTISVGFNGSNSYVDPTNIAVRSITGGGMNSAITATYTATYAGNQFEITSTLTPRGNNIIVSDTIKNISGKDLKNVWIARSYDTMLDGNDAVPVKYLGSNNGLYIAQNDSKLSYNFHMPIGPEGWAADQYNRQIIPAVFSNPTNLGQASLNKPADDIAFSNGDSGIYMKWSPKDFPKDSSREIGYIVGVTPENVDAPEVTVARESFEYLGGDYDLSGTVLSKDPSVTDMKMYYQVDRESPKEFKLVANDPLGSAHSWSTIIPESELTGGYPKQISVYATDSNGYYSDAKTVDLTEPKSQPVTVKYLNQEGKLLKETKITGRYGEPYEVEVFNFPNYTVENQPENSRGTISNEPQEVVIKYVGQYVGETSGKVTVRYVNQKGKEITAAVTASGNGLFGSPYTTEQKDIEHYEFVGIDAEGAPKNGFYTSSIQTVTFIYQGKNLGEKGKITVEYQNQEGKLLGEDFITGRYGDSYDVSEKLLKEFRYYTRDPLPNNSKGTITDQPQKVIITYTGESFGNSSGKVTVKYVNQNRDEIADEVQANGSGLFGGSYTTEQKKIPNYEFKEVDSSNSGVTGFYTESPQTVIYKYQGKEVGEAGKITVEYRNQEGKLLDQAFITGRYGDIYDVSLNHLKEFDYYTRDTLPTNAKGRINNQPQMVIVTYTGKQVGNAQGKVKAKYINQEGLEISTEEDATGSGLFGSPYTTEQKEIPNYEFKEIDSSGAKQTGVYKETTQNVVYKYKGKSVGENGKITIEYRNQVGALLGTEFIIGSYGDKYDIERDNNGALVKNFDHYTINSLPENKKGFVSNEPQLITVTYIGELVGEDQGKVTATYVNQAGEVLSESTNASGDGRFGSPYTTEQKDIANYDFTGVSPNGAPQNGTYSMKPQTVIFKYTGQKGGNIIVKYVNQSGKELKTEMLKGNVGNATTINPPTTGIFSNYNLVPNQNLAATFSPEEQVITINYDGKPAKPLTVKHLGTDGHVFPSEIIENKKYGDSYRLEPSEQDGYSFDRVVGNKVGTYTNEKQQVTFYYKKNPAQTGTITVKYLEVSTGKVLAPSIELTGIVGEVYPTTVKPIKGYNTPDNQSGVFQEGSIDVIYEYSKPVIIGESIIVKYVDVYGRPIKGVGQKIIPGAAIGSGVTINDLTPGGYSLISSKPAQTSLSYQAYKQVITCTVAKEPTTSGRAAVRKAALSSSGATIRYVNDSDSENASEIAPSFSVSGFVGENIWKTDYLPEFIEDYELVSDIASFNTELFDDEGKIINVVYHFAPTTDMKKEVKIKIVDPSGDLLKTVTQVVIAGEAYTIGVPEVEGYTYQEDTSINLTGTWEDGMPEEYTLTYDLI